MRSKLKPQGGLAYRQRRSNSSDHNSGVHSVDSVKYIQVSNMVILDINASHEVGVKRRYQQDLAGQTIHDDGSSTHGRFSQSDFIPGTLKTYSNVIVNGVTGQSSNPKLGQVRDGDDIMNDVLLLENQNYNIDSSRALVEEQGYQEDIAGKTSHYTKRYFKELNGKIVERVYKRNPEDTHFIRVNVLTKEDYIRKTCWKMQNIHEYAGHPSADTMCQMCSHYAPSCLNYTIQEAQIWKNHGQCRACLEGKTIARRKDAKGRLIFVQYINYGNMEGIHFDVFYINNQWAFWLAKSHKYKMQWVVNVGIDFTTEIIRENCLEFVFGDYRRTGKEIGFTRSDTDPKFQPLRPWIQKKGMVYYMAPVGVKTSRGERGIRTEKEVIRTLYHAMHYKMPLQWVPFLVSEANYLITIRFNKDLGMTPREAFYGTKLDYRNEPNIKFGDIISYSSVATDSSIFESRLNYGAVVGRDPETGNLLTENFRTKLIDKVAVYKEKISVDDNIRYFYDNYNSIAGFQYSIVNNIRMALVHTNGSEQYTNPPISRGLHARSSESTEANQDSRRVSMPVNILSSEEYKAFLDGDLPSIYNIANAQTNVVDEESQRHDSNHEIPSQPHLVDRIEIMLVDILKSLKDDLIIGDDENLTAEATMNISAAVLDELQEVVGPEIQEMLINDNIDPEHNLHVIMNLVQMSYKKMHSKRPDETEQAGIKEMKVISDRDTVKGVHLTEIPRGTKILYIMTKYAEKFKLGIYDKVKARLLLGGDQLQNEYGIRWDEVSARTIALAALYTIIAIMAYEGMDVYTMDFMNAFLYGKLQVKDQCYARIPPEESALLLKIDHAKWAPFVNPKDKCIYVKVIGSLYGHPAAAKIWYDYLKEKLEKIGFKPLKCEPCIFIRFRDGTFDLIGIHVDDLLMGSKNPKFREEMEQFKRDYFRGEGTIENGPNLEYLNIMMAVNKADRSVTITQESYWKSVCSKFGLSEDDKFKVDIPHRCDFMKRVNERMLIDPTTSDAQLKKQFLSIIMSIFWGALRTFPQILVVVSVLATLASRATSEDYDDAMRVLKFINKSKSDGIRLKINGKVQICSFVDASCNFHWDTKGQLGNVTTIGSEGYGGPIAFSSSRAKVNMIGSMQYELLALHGGLSTPLFLKELVEEIGYEQRPILIFEDNKALIDLIRRGKISTGATKHIAAKYYLAKDLMIQGIIQLRHCPTFLMIADILTKNLSGIEFKKMSQRLRNTVEQDPTLTDDIYRALYENSTENVYLSEDDKKVVKLLSMVVDYLESQP